MKLGHSERERKRSLWFRGLVENCVVYGDRGYRGCEGGIVCDSREMRAKRQVVEGVISQIKLFNAGSGWRTLTCVLVYVYMLMLLDIVITGGVNLRPNFSPSVSLI